MYTLGFPFRPWRGEKAIVDGASIRAYVEETAREHGVDGRDPLRPQGAAAPTGRRPRRAGRSRPKRTARRGASPARFLYLGSGYYDYDAGYRPEWPGEADFAGRIVHPQFWPEGLDVAGKRIVVIGSGATAVTLAPALAEQGAKVTMLQRSPSYVVSRPSRDRARAARSGPA